MNALAPLRSSGELWRYYQAAVVNTVFGYSLYALCVAAGINMYAAQIIGHFLGMAFNYFTYSRHTFRDKAGSKVRFLLAYIGNYFLGLAVLTILAPMISSPYLIGIITIIIVSLINYFVLKNLVFLKRVSG